MEGCSKEIKEEEMRQREVGKEVGMRLNVYELCVGRIIEHTQQ